MAIKINKSFYVLIVISAVLGFLEQLFLLVLAIFLHELSHVIVCKIFSKKCDYITLSAFGLNAYVRNIDTLTLGKKVLITVVGVLTNLFLYLLLSNSNGNQQIVFFRNINLVLAIINILPIYPLDGSKLFLYLLSDIWGQLRVVDTLITISKFLSIIIMIFGLFLYVLFPFNIYIYLFGMYLFKLNSKKSKSILFMEFYLFIINNKKNYDKVLISKNIFVPTNTKIIDILNYMSMNTYLIIQLKKDEEYITINENDFVSFIIKNGIQGTFDTFC